ncbi:hypothetical protein DFJ74DRAFT_658499 [Hyaloraphidium curvatum]|nr:hypothetical protein DFJ74DRAFT_658499 [Hyaloraphidium curvatum]
METRIRVSQSSKPAAADDASPGTASAPFSPEGWLALFPLPAPPADNFPTSGAPPDFAAKLRTPLTPPDVLDALVPWPNLRNLARVHFAMAVWLAARKWRYTVHSACLVACICLVWPFADGRFGAKEMAGGTAAVATVAASFFYGALFSGRGWPGRSGLRESKEFLASRFAGLVAWANLVGNQKPDGELLEHFPNDRFCSCPAKTCAGGLPRAAFVYRLFELVFRLGAGFLIWIFMFWTPFVTLADRTWSSPWGATIASLGVLDIFLFNVEVIPYLPPNVAIGRITSRLRYRATKLTLGRLLDTFHAQLESPSEDGKLLENTGPTETHLALQGNLASRWAAGVLAGFPVAGAISFASVVLFGAIATLATGSCIPAWMVACFLYILGTLLFDLWNVASLNSEVSSISSLYLAAQQHIRTLLILSHPASGPDPRLSGVIANMRAHEAALGSYAGVVQGRRGCSGSWWTTAPSGRSWSR